MNTEKSVSANSLDTDWNKVILLRIDKSYSTTKSSLFLTIFIVYNLFQEGIVGQITLIRHRVNTYILERYYDNFEYE